MNRDTFRIDRDEWGSIGPGPEAGRPAEGSCRLGPVLLELEGRRLLSQTFTVTNTASTAAGARCPMSSSRRMGPAESERHG